MSEFKDFAEKVRSTGEKTLSVRDLLRLFGQERRGKHAAAKVRSSLRKEKLVTEPNFEVVHIDTPIKIRPSLPPTSPAAKDEHAETNVELPAVIEGRDVILTIGQIREADIPPQRVTRNDTVTKAVTLMMNHGLTHLAVMNGDRSVDGVISWETIGKARAAKRPDEKVQHYMAPVRIVEVDSALFDAVRDIIESEVVLVRAKDNKICGMVSGRDIARQFVTLSEPFLFLEQIENHLRAILEKARLSHDAIRALVNPADAERIAAVKSVDDLTFGETARAFAKDDVWAKLHLALDCKVFCHRLEEIRSIRNKVMHFHPDGISSGDREILRKTRQMLQTL